MSVIHGVDYGTPTLDLNFARNKSLIDTVTGRNLVTFTRASTGTYVGADGLIKTAAANESRFDHNPATGESLGLLIEEARTNFISHSVTTGSVNGIIGSGGSLPTGWVFDRFQGGITIEVIASGIESNGLAYVDIKFSGTTTDGQWFLLRPGNSFAAVSGTTYSVSMYVKTVAGVAPPLLSFQSTSCNGALELAAITPTLTRYSSLITATSSITSFPRFNIGSTSAGQTFNHTMRFAGIQLEAGAFPTSYIPTTGSTVTRSADVASITGTNFSRWHNSQGIGTIASLAKGIKTAKLGAIYSILSTDNSFSNMIEVEYDSRSPQLRIYKNSAGIIDAGTINNDTFAKTCMSYSPGSYAAVLNGSIIATSNSAGDFPTPLSLLYLGRGYNEDGGRLNGTISRLTYYPTRLQDFQLQQLTK